MKYEVIYSSKAIIGLGIGIFIILILGYFFRKKELLVKGFSIEKTFRYFQKFSNILKFKIFLLSILRYLVFSGMFYGLLLFFGAEIAFSTALARSEERRVG